MKRTFPALLLLFAVFFTPGTSSAQFTFTLSYDTVNFPQPDTVSFGGFVTYEFDILNTGPTTFADSLWILRALDTIGNVDTLFAGMDSIFSMGMSHHTIVDSVGSARYSGGINVVVIWPTAPNVSSTDTIFDWLYVEPLVGASVARPVQGLRIYPNPAANMLRFRTDASAPVITETTLYDTQGRLLRRETGLPERLDLSDLPAGTYILRLRDAEGRTFGYRVRKAL